MNPYYTAALIFTVLVLTHPSFARWLRARVADVRDAMNEPEEE